MAISFCRSERETGSSVVEFMFCSLIWLPLLLGTVVFGINIVKAMQVSQLCRDTGHMLGQNVDFTTTQNQSLLAQLGSGLNIRSGDGNGAIVLSQITLIADSDCTAGGFSNSCANRGKYVFKSMVVFGNATYARTTLGSPPLSTIAAGYVIKPADYLNNSSYRADNFSNYLTFTSNVSGQYAYVSEVFVNTQALQWSAFGNAGSSARSIF
jgi:hypothetical protein